MSVNKYVLLKVLANAMQPKCCSNGELCLGMVLLYDWYVTKLSLAKLSVNR